jgi:hypothetical protein
VTHNVGQQNPCQQKEYLTSKILYQDGSQVLVEGVYPEMTGKNLADREHLVRPDNYRRNATSKLYFKGNEIKDDKTLAEYYQIPLTISHCPTDSA